MTTRRSSLWGTTHCECHACRPKAPNYETSPVYSKPTLYADRVMSPTALDTENARRDVVEAVSLLQNALKRLERAVSGESSR